MFGKAGGIGAVNQSAQAGEVVNIKWLIATDGQAHTVHRQGKTLRKGAQLCMGSAAIAHVILCVYFDPFNRAGRV